ncbi:MAG: GntR family transcriptional regulator [Clostridiales bacterium]|jgi:GntR family transcriptional regulator|nr:GntR family transcriptional regulator [Clostridiales bacterium]
MTWELKADRPIYLQLIEQIELRIVSGMYNAGQKLPPVRDLAAQAAVNPNTMQKALSELERSGLVYSQRTSGRFITEDEGMIQQAKESLAKEQISAFFEKMQQLGFSRNETLSLMQQAAKEEE